jgi:hypothetical protein
MSSPNAQSRFELERDEPPEIGEIIETFNVSYKVVAVTHDHEDFDGLIQVEWITGPGQVAG